ncbi:MAG: PhoU domain-containing protein [Pseudonocardiaceae bacterium]
MADVPIGLEKVRAANAMCHAELDALITDLARTTRLAARLLTNASIALHQNDLALAGRVISERDQLKVMHDDMELRCITLLTRRSPAIGDLQVVVAALPAVGHLKRMGDLARHIALLARLKHPTPMSSGKVRSVLARMSLLASQFAEDAASALERQDPLSGSRLAVADDEVDALRRHLFGILFAEDWSHSVEQAVDAALLGRYYERFADHAVAIARQACTLAAGRSAVRAYPLPECEPAACQARPRSY